MDRSIPLLLIGLVFGGGIGFLVAASTGVTLDGHDHAMDHSAGQSTETKGASHDHTQHDHSALQDVTGIAPTLNVTIVPDPATGWNMHIQVSNFTFAPDHAGQSAVDGEGHAHLYVNGTKIARVYGNWYHIGSLPSGTATIKIGLYTNDHKALAVDGTPIIQTVIIYN
ncbi:MAG: putative Zn-binding protein involved in type VI secretion [Paracoccaceae bacterium]|jgi:uncharacterized Zn-binding protein involved in type VI secretion